MMRQRFEDGGLYGATNSCEKALVYGEDRGNAGSNAAIFKVRTNQKKEWFKHFSFNHFTRIGVILVFWFYKNKKQERKKRSEQRSRHTDGPTRVPRTYQNSFI